MTLQGRNVGENTASATLLEQTQPNVSIDTTLTAYYQSIEI